MARIISFGHRIPSKVRKEIEKELGHDTEFIEAEFYLNLNRPITPQIEKILEPLIDGCGDVPFVILPGVSVASGIIIAILHGILGRFPYIVELTREKKEKWRWKLKEIHDTDKIRQNARTLRFTNASISPISKP